MAWTTVAKSMGKGRITREVALDTRVAHNKGEGKGKAGKDSASRTEDAKKLDEERKKQEKDAAEAEKQKQRDEQEATKKARGEEKAKLDEAAAAPISIMGALKKDMAALMGKKGK